MTKDEIMRLADAHADAVSDHRCAWASRSHKLEKARECDEARAALEAAVLAQGEPVAVLRERERCAKICDSYAEEGWSTNGCAAAIRSGE